MQERSLKQFLKASLFFFGVNISWVIYQAVTAQNGTVVAFWSAN